MEELEGCQSQHGNLPAVDPQDSLESKMRQFLQNAFSYESNKNSPVKEKDCFSTLEIRSLVLLKELKKVKYNNTEDVANVISRESSPKLKMIKKIIKAKLIDPFKSKGKKTYNCPHCDKSFEASSIKPLQFHCRKHHPEKAKVDKKDFEQEIEVECELLTKKGVRCGRSFPRHQLRRHLESKKLHKDVTRKPEGKVFRGWRFYEDIVDVLWRPTADEEICSEEDVEMEVDNTENNEDSEGNDDNQNLVQLTQKSVMEVSRTNLNLDMTHNPQDQNVLIAVPCHDQDPCSNNPTETMPDLGKQTQPAPEIPMEVEGQYQYYFIPNSQVLDGLNQGERHQEYGDSEVINQGERHQDYRYLMTINPNLVHVPEEPVVNTQDQFSGPHVLPSNKLLSSALIPNSNYNENIEDDNMSCVFNEVLPVEGGQNYINEIREVIPSQVQLGENSTITSVLPRTEEDSDLVAGASCTSVDMGDHGSIELEVAVGSASGDISNIVRDGEEGLGEAGQSDAGETGAGRGEGELNMSSNDDGLNQEIFSQKTIYEELTAFGFEKVKDNILAEKQVRFLINGEVWSCANEKISMKPETETEEDRHFMSDSEESNDSIDSDYDEDLDSDIFITKKRQERRKVRMMNRDNIEQADNLREIPENKVFIEEFMSWLGNKTSLQTTNPKPSNQSSKKGHAFSYHDSFLNFMTKKNREFNLGRLVDFKNKNNFLSIESPVEWISSAAGPDKTSNPTRQKEQLKTHATIREFISHKLNVTAFDGNDVLQTLVINNHLKSIEDQIGNLKLFKKLTTLYEKDKNKAKRMKLISNPSSDQMEYESVRTWMKSKEAQDLESSVRSISKEALRTKKIKARDFGKVANFARFTLAISDKNRPSSYNFTLMDYMSKIACWLPEEVENLWSIENLPEGWQMFKERDEPPTCFVIGLDGSQAEIKLQAETNIIMDMKTYEIIELYQDVKKMLFGKLSLDSPFFINFKGNMLSRLQRYPGSLVEKFGNTVGIPDFKMTDVRKALEGAVQGSSEAKNTKDINNHTSAVVPVYDNAKQMRRSLFMSSIAAVESSGSVDKEEVKQHYNLRKRSDKAERSKIQDEASKFLVNRKRKKPVTDLTPSSLEKGDIVFLKSVFTDNDIKGT